MLDLMGHQMGQIQSCFVGRQTLAGRLPVAESGAICNRLLGLVSVECQITHKLRLNLTWPRNHNSDYLRDQFPSLYLAFLA